MSGRLGDATMTCQKRCNSCGYCTPEVRVKYEGTGDRPYFVYIDRYFTGLRFNSASKANDVAVYLQKKV